MKSCGWLAPLALRMSWGIRGGSLVVRFRKGNHCKLEGIASSQPSAKGELGRDDQQAQIRTLCEMGQLGLGLCGGEGIAWGPLSVLEVIRFLLTCPSWVQCERPLELVGGSRFYVWLRGWGVILFQYLAAFCLPEIEGTVSLGRLTHPSGAGSF